MRLLGRSRVLVSVAAIGRLTRGAAEAGESALTNRKQLILVAQSTASQGWLDGAPPEVRAQAVNEKGAPYSLEDQRRDDEADYRR